MAENVESSEFSFEILVHTAAKDTNAQDAIYRDQGAALLDYMKRRLRKPHSVDELPRSSTRVQETPRALEILVPKTESVSKNKTVQGPISSLAIDESILVSVGSAYDEPTTRSTETNANGISIQSFRSTTSSTASILEGNVYSHLSRKKSTKAQPSKQPEHQTGGSVGNAILIPNATPSIESLVSPDSLKFKLQSPNGCRVRKRELNPVVEESRSGLLLGVLREQSPNKRIKLSVTADTGNPQKSPRSYSSDTAGPRLYPDGWLSSIAQLTSSSSEESIPKPLPSAEAQESKSDDAFLAPWPSSGHEPYRSHLVGTLALVAGSQRLRAAYRPKAVKRKIEPLERGYWHLKIPFSWSSADQDSFWKMLEEMIVEGKCGWGNWVEHIKDPLDKAGSTEASKGSQTETVPSHVSEIKVWCWGEVVREIWLSLLMASKRQTLRLGMIWYDSCDNIIIRMR